MAGAYKLFVEQFEAILCLNKDAQIWIESYSFILKAKLDNLLMNKEVHDNFLIFVQ